jgi:hypothetical protein
MLIELRSSETDPNNSPSHLIQQFKETLILKPNTRISLVNALITSDTSWYADLPSGGIWTNSVAGYNLLFSDLGANLYFKYWTDSVNNPPTTPTSWFNPLGQGRWLFYNTEPTATNTTDGTNPGKILTVDINTGVINLSVGDELLPDVVPDRVYIRNTTTDIVTKGTESILINVVNFPINSRNASGNTDNHIATIPALKDVNSNAEATNFYEPYNATSHKLDNEADLNLNHFEVALTNSDGTPRTDLIHPTQLTFLLTPDYK